MPEQFQPGPEEVGADPIEVTPTKPKARVADHPISSFNLNTKGQNPDFPDFDDENAPELLPSTELQAELEDLRLPINPESGQHLGYLELNRDAADPRPVVSFFEYSVDADHAGSKHLLEQLALQSQRHIYAFENPSTGGSDKLTAEQHEALKKGDFEPIARSILENMQAVGLKAVDLNGHSLGARIAGSVAAHASEYGIVVKNLVLMEPAGLDDASIGKLIYRLGVKEGWNMIKYQKHVQDPRGKETFDTPIDVVKNYAGMIRRDTKGNIWAYPKGLGKPTLATDLILALKTQEGMKTHLITGGASQIARRKTVNETYTALSTVYGPRVHMVRLPGDTHMLNMGAARRMAWHISRLIDN
ncbi:MAG TPA: alpha/beta hydrolase [Candidatus Saccharimonadales bacterium]|nr:alpha/beta hydrolase [Candidatus Saccharimonadales bacterium]